MIKRASQLLSTCGVLVLLSACQNTYLTQTDIEKNTAPITPQGEQAATQPVKSNYSPYPEFVHSGDILPIRLIKTLDGDEINLQRIGKKKLVILFATWCSDSNRLLKALNSSPLLEDDTIEVIAIAREEDKETVNAWQQARNIKIPLAVDTNRAIYKKFAAGGIPRIITVAENNKIIKMNLAEGSEQLKKIVW
jgi:peroxiredoxin